MFMRLQALLVKTEVTYGTDPTPTGAANAILAQNVKISPMKGSDVKRDHDTPYFGANPTIPVGMHASISFEVEVKSSGTAGVAPAIDPLLQACKLAAVIVAATSVTYNPHSGTQKSATIYWNVDGTLFKLVGCRGTFSYKVNVLGIVVMAFEMTGIYAPPSTAALPAVTLGTQLTQIPQAASKANTPTFTMAGTGLFLRNLTFNAGNEVKARFLIGSESIIIADAAESIDLQIEAVALATFNPFARADDAAPIALSLVHGVGAGKITTLSVPSAQVMRPDGLEEQDGIVEWKLKLTPLPVSGNDQFTIAFT